MDDEIDFAKVIVMIVLLGIIVSMCVVLFLYKASIDEKPFVTACSNNPTLRYAENCTTHDDCINKCVQKMKTNPR
jgi:hypothetical protein